VPIEVEGVPNLHRINRRLYRSAQPKSEGFVGLARNLGIKTVINLRSLHSDDSLAQETGLALVRVPIRSWDIRDDRVIEALCQVRRAVERGPVLVHCNHGADRTGLILALYRTLYDGWSKGAAIEEMLHGEFGFHAVWANIPMFIEKVDVNRLRQLVEMT
jgi:protein tyrosine/serine phosphatase